MVQQLLPVRALARLRRPALLLALGLFAETASATGFFINQQGVKALGRVGAGNAAIADDLETIFFNPAGLTEIWAGREGRSRFGLGTHLIVPRSKLRNMGSTAATPGTLGVPVPYEGADMRNPTDPTPVPNVYWAHELLPGRAAIGVGINFPFGLSTEYASDWFGRYDALEASLRTVNLSAAGAWRFGSGISVGGGLDLQYARSFLSSAIPDPLAAGGPTPATDGRVDTKGHDWTPGFNLGVLVPLSARTRIGVHFRSGMKHSIKGRAVFSGLAGPLAPFNRRVDANAELHLPAVATVGVRHAASANLQLLASIDWYDWSRFREVRVRFADGTADAVRPADFRDATAVAAGAEYRVSPQLTARGGVRFDQTPTVNSFRDTTLPDAKRLWIGLGATYERNKSSAWDFAFTHANFRSADVSVVRSFFDGTPLASTIHIHARVKSVVNTLAIGYRHAF